MAKIVTFLAGVSNPADGVWQDVGRYLNKTFQVSGIVSGDIAHVCASCAGAKPANNTNGFQIGTDVTADGLRVVNDRYKWMKVRLSTDAGGGTVTATAVVHDD